MMTTRRRTTTTVTTKMTTDLNVSTEPTVTAKILNIGKTSDTPKRPSRNEPRPRGLRRKTAPRSLRKSEKPPEVEVMRTSWNLRLSMTIPTKRT